MSDQEKEIHVKKDVALEALRGLAAFVVVFWHLLLAYAPGRVPVLPSQDQSFSILGQPWFGLVNGTSSVNFFFVLSGFVLSRKAWLRGDPMILARGAVKRWPRLAAPVLIAVLFSWALFVTQSYRYAEAGALTHSWWLNSFPIGVPAGSEFKPGFIDAFAQGAALTFLKGDASYVPSLWTMHIELIGSFIVFGLTAILIVLRDAGKFVIAWLLIVAILVCGYAQPFMACFAVGVTLAVLLGNKAQEIPLWAGIALAIGAVWLMSYFPGAGIHAWLARHFRHAPPDTYVHATGSVIAIIVIEATPVLRRMFSGQVSVALGKLSFPVYLLHIPVLCSAGAGVFLTTQGVLPGIWPNVAAAMATIGVTILLAWPLALFDSWWVRKLGVATDKLVPRAESPASCRDIQATK